LWHRTVFGDPTLANAILDRINLKGPSLRRRLVTSVKISKYQYVGFDFPILDEMW
jgi:hypothetical protein